MIGTAAPVLPSRSGFRTRSGGEVVAMATGLAAAAILRAALAGSQGAASIPAAIVFAAASAAIAIAAGWRRPRPRLRAAPRGSLTGVLIGIFGAALLVVGPELVRPAGAHLGANAPLTVLAVWMPVTAMVAVAEEAVLRGAVFTAMDDHPGLAVALSAIGFGLIHIPLYGPGAVPLDVAAGVWLGGLRLAGGGVTAPMTAHVLADLASGWML